MGSQRDHPDLTSTLRVAQETGRLRLDSRSRTALFQTSTTHDQPPTIHIPSPAGNPSAAAATAAQTEEKTSEEISVGGGGGGGGGTGSGFFGCNICFEMAVDPVLTPCGHLFCWSCIYQWLNGGHHPRKCPVCMGDVVTDNVIPIYGRGPESPTRPADDRTDPLRGVLPPNNIPPRPSAHRVVTGERRPGRRSSSSSNPGSSSARQYRPAGFPGEAATEHYRARRDSSGLLSPMVDFVGVTTGPHPAYAGIPLEGQAYFPQPLEPGIYFAPITSINPQQYFSFAPGGAGISAGSVDRRNNIPRPAPPPPTAHLLQCFLEEPSRNLYLGQVREPPLVVLGMEDSLHDGLAEFLSGLDDDPPIPPPPPPSPPLRGTVNGGGGERGTSRAPTGIPLFPAFPLQPDLGLFGASSSSTTSTPGSAPDHSGNTSTALPPPSLGDLCFSPPPEKRRRF